MNNSGIIRGVLVVVGLVVIAGLVYYFIFSPGRKYSRLLNEANGLYEQRRFEDAKKLYTEALEIRTGETLPRQRIHAIDSIQQKLELDIRYDEKIQKADQLYSEEKYLEASQFYFDALNVKPDEDYPVAQIKKIQQALKETDEAGQVKSPPGEKVKTKTPASRPKVTGMPKNMKKTADGDYFHVVVGVFSDHSKAIRLQRKMIEMGKESRIINRPGGLEAVTFGSYDNLNEAFNFLEFARNDINKDAWVLYYETN